MGVALATLFVFAAGPATPLARGGLTVAGGALRLVLHRPLTLAAGVLALAVALLRLTWPAR